jgi:hypothetical protein
MQDKQEFVAKWAPRVGERAARLSVSSARLVGFGGLLVPVWALLFVLGHSEPAIVVVASILLASDIALLISGVVLMSRLYRELSTRFGTKVWFLNSPSLRDGQFESWCKRHGVEPSTGTPAAGTSRNLT